MKKKKLMTLCIIHQHPRILLGMKKRGFGEGRWNGFGGKVQKGEDIETATKREVSEEVGITLLDLEKRGILQFEFQEGFEEMFEVHVYKTEKFSGEPKEGEEMKPRWFHVDEIPFNSMWSDDIHWFPFFLENKKFKGKFLFDEKDKVLEKEVKEVNEL